MPKRSEFVIGQEFKSYKVIELPFIDKGVRKIRVQCKCGSIRKVYCNAVKTLKNCRRCGSSVNRAFKIGDEINNFVILGYETYKIGSKYHSRYKIQCKCGSEPYSLKSIDINQAKKCMICSYSIHGTDHFAYQGTKNVPKTYFSRVYNGAIRRNLEFSITIDDAQKQFDKQNGICTLSKIPIKIGNQKIETTASLDRIDNNKGYTVDNIQWIHKDINWMKQDFNEQYFKETCTNVHYSSNNNEKLDYCI